MENTKTIVFTIFILLLNGCGATKPLYVEDGLQIYMETILDAQPLDIPNRIDKVYIADELNVKNAPNAVGVCRRYSSGKREIILKKDAWERYTDEFRVALMAHEFIHCQYSIKNHTHGGLMDPYITESVIAIRKLGLKKAMLEALGG